jgi:hypothetical protein
MKQFEQVVDKDPLSLRKYDTGNGSTSYKRIYMLLAAIPVFLIISVVFYCLGSLTGGSSSIPHDTYTSSSRTSLTSNSSDDSSTSTFTPPPAQGESFTADKSKIADSLDKIQVGLRIMPSQNDEKGIIIMKSSNASNA